MPELDVYRDWLKIPDSDRPLNHYQLLRLRKFEDDPEKIRVNYRKLNAHVRKFATGDYEVQSQALLNELAKAMLCLTDAERKEQYDHSLGRADRGEMHRRSLEELLIRRGGLKSEQLAEAKQYAEALGMPLYQAAVQKKFVNSAAAMQAYAESSGVPFLDLSDVTVDDELLARMPAVTARQHSCVPVLEDANHLLIAAPHLMNEHLEEELQLRWSMPVRRVLCTSADVNRFINEHYPREKAEAEIRAQHATVHAPPKPPGKFGQFLNKAVEWIKENSTKK